MWFQNSAPKTVLKRSRDVDSECEKSGEVAPLTLRSKTPNVSREPHVLIEKTHSGFFSNTESARTTCCFHFTRGVGCTWVVSSFAGDIASCRSDGMRCSCRFAFQPYFNSLTMLSFFDCEKVRSVTPLL